MKEVANGWTRTYEEMKLEIAMLRAANSNLADKLTAMSGINAVWEQYKHLDILLSDEEWMKEDGHPMSPQRTCLYDCWRAIKRACGGGKP